MPCSATGTVPAHWGSIRPDCQPGRLPAVKLTLCLLLLLALTTAAFAKPVPSATIVGLSDRLRTLEDASWRDPWRTWADRLEIQQRQQDILHQRITIAFAAGVVLLILLFLVLQRRNTLRFREVGITASVGIAGFSAQCRDANSIYACADRALYESKTSGKNRVTLALPGGGFVAPSAAELFY